MIKKYPFSLLTGPCSVESQTQIWEVAQELKKRNLVDILRAGIWKPRTKPGNFEGIGVQGIDWLLEIEKKLSLPVMIEVANAAQFELALEKGLRHFWIGARTTVNPFYVQELADIAKTISDIVVYIKNPIHPDLQLWQGAVDRFQKAGIEKIGLIHRGFFQYKTHLYRNEPFFALALQLKENYPQLPFICDVSHIAGDRVFLPQLMQQAFDLNYTGLMVEVHPYPESALSDAKQQITPVVLEKLLEKIVFRFSEETLDTDYLLQVLRIQIDQTDQQIAQQMILRMELVKKVAALKKQNNIKILQEKRWKYVFDYYLDMLEKAGLSREFALKWVEILHEESVRLQNEWMNKKE